jgi:hypothetical protein
MKKLYVSLALVAAVLAFTPDWKTELHAQTGSYQLNSTYKGSAVSEHNNVQ